MDELIHYGIIGMKWGVRRYQNADGTLTEAGKKKYSKSSEYVTKNGEKVSVLTSKPKNFGDVEETYHSMYSDGKKVCIAYLDKHGSETNINWISTKSKQQGKGYAQTMMDHLVKYSKDDNGSKIISLEVPDDDPDALHIYKKYGFKEVNDSSYDDYPLTSMKRKI